MGDDGAEVGGAPRANALLPVRRDVAGVRFPERAAKRLTALAEAIREIQTVVYLGRVALHAMGDRDEIEAVLDWIAQVSFGHSLAGAGRDFDMKGRLVDRRLDLVRNRGHRTQIGDNRVEIASGEDLVETIGHDRRERDPGRPNSLDERLFDVVCTPLADTAVWCGSDIRALDGEGR